MKANLLKLISILCVLCMLVAVFASCGETTETKSETKEETTAESSKETTKETTGESDTEKETVKETEKETEKETVKETEKETVKETVKETEKETVKETVKETETETEKETIELKTETVTTGFSDSTWTLDFTTSNKGASGYDEGDPNPQFRDDGSIHAFGKAPFKVTSKETYSFEYGFKLSYSTNMNDTPANMAMYWGRSFITKIGDFSFVMVSPFHEYYNGSAPIVLKLVEGGEIIKDPSNPNNFNTTGDVIAECYTDAWAHNNERFDDVDGFLNGSWVIDYKDGVVTVTNEYHGVIEWEMWDGTTTTEVDFGTRGFTDASIEFAKTWGGTDYMGEYAAYTDLVVEKYIPA